MDDKLWNQIVNLRTTLKKQKQIDDAEKINLFHKLHSYIENLQKSKELEQNDMKEILRLEKELEKLLIGYQKDRSENPDKSVSDITSITSDISTEINATVAKVDNLESEMSIPKISSLSESTMNTLPENRVDKSEDSLKNGHASKPSHENMFDNQEQLMQVYEGRLDQLKSELARCKRILFSKYCESCGANQLNGSKEKTNVMNKKPTSALNGKPSSAEINESMTQNNRSRPKTQAKNNQNETPKQRPNTLNIRPKTTKPPAKTRNANSASRDTQSAHNATRNTRNTNNAPRNSTNTCNVTTKNYSDEKNRNNVSKKTPAERKASQENQFNISNIPQLESTPSLISSSSNEGSSNFDTAVNSTSYQSSQQTTVKSNKQKPISNDKIQVTEASEVECVTPDSVSNEMDRLFGKTFRHISDPIPAQPVQGTQTKIDKSKRKFAVQAKVNQKLITDDDSLTTWSSLLQDFDNTKSKLTEKLKK